jgi:O-antigen/teichoic acid export membrane protein
MTVVLTLGAVFTWGDDRDSLLMACVASYAFPMGITGIASALMVLRPSYRAGARSLLDSLQLIKEAAPFAFLAISGGAIYNIDVLIMSQLVSSKELSEYGVLQRVLGILMSLYSAVLAANWPSWTEALIRRESKSIIRSAATTLTVAMVFMLVTICAITLMRDSIIRFFLPNSGAISATLPILFGLYLLTRMWTDTFAVILQAKGSTRIFWIIVPLQASISIALQLLLGSRFGAPGVLAGLTIALWVTAAWAIPRVVVRQVFSAN